MPFTKILPRRTFLPLMIFVGTSLSCGGAELEDSPLSVDSVDEDELELEQALTAAATPQGTMKFTVQPGGAGAYVGFSQQPVVTLYDASGAVSKSTANVKLKIASGPSGAILYGLNVNQQASNGVAKFSNLSLSLRGSYVLNASAPGFGSVNSTALVVPARTGATYYVSPTGNDANDGKSSSRPWTKLIGQTHTNLNISAQGHWAQFYSASLNGQDEYSRARFDRDLQWNQLLFSPLAIGEPPQVNPEDTIKTIGIAGVNAASGQNGTVTVESLDPVAWTSTTATFDVVGTWKRVDELASCPNPDVIMIEAFEDQDDAINGYAGPGIFQLAFCQASDPLTSLRLLVPVVFRPSPGKVGERYDAIRTIQGGSQPVVEIDLGDYFLQIKAINIRGMFGTRMTLFDAAHTRLGGATLIPNDIFMGAPERPPEGVAWQSADGMVEADVVRQFVGSAGGTLIYAPLSFMLRFGGETHRVVAWDKLYYDWAWHNRGDTLIAEDGDVRMFWLEYGLWAEVRAERISDGVELLPATEVR